MKFEKIIKFGMPFDKRSDNPPQNYGIRSMRIYFILKKGQKAVQIIINTKYYLPQVMDEYYQNNRDIFMKNLNLKYNSEEWKNPFNCLDVGYHSSTRMFEDQGSNPCDILKKGKCYYDGSSFRGKDDKIAERFAEKGEDFIWEYLEKYFEEVFGK